MEKFTTVLVITSIIISAVAIYTSIANLTKTLDQQNKLYCKVVVEQDYTCKK